jgi:hypothetical protein
MVGFAYIASTHELMLREVIDVVALRSVFFSKLALPVHSRAHGDGQAEFDASRRYLP